MLQCLRAGAAGAGRELQMAVRAGRGRDASAARSECCACAGTQSLLASSLASQMFELDLPALSEVEPREWKAVPGWRGEATRPTDGLDYLHNLIGDIDGNLKTVLAPTKADSDRQVRHSTLEIRVEKDVVQVAVIYSEPGNNYANLSLDGLEEACTSVNEKGVNTPTTRVVRFPLPFDSRHQPDLEHFSRHKLTKGTLSTFAPPKVTLVSVAGNGVWSLAVPLVYKLSTSKRKANGFNADISDKQYQAIYNFLEERDGTPYYGSGGGGSDLHSLLQAISKKVCAADLRGRADKLTSTCSYAGCMFSFSPGLGIWRRAPDNFAYEPE